MKTKKQTEVSSSEVRIDIPNSWDKISAKQFDIFADIAAREDIAELALPLFFMRIANLEPLGPVDGDSVQVTFRRSNEVFTLSTYQMAVAVEQLQFLNNPDASLYLNKQITLSLQKYGYSDLLRKPFANFLSVDAIYAHAVQSQNPESMIKAAAAIFPKARLRKNKRDTAKLSVMAILMYAAFKDYLVGKFRNLFGSAAGEVRIASQSSVSDSINAQIRALTKGDVTAEQRVLETQTVRALTELDALAREYQELKALDKK